LRSRSANPSQLIPVFSCPLVVCRHRLQFVLAVVSLRLCVRVRVPNGRVCVCEWVVLVDLQELQLVRSAAKSLVALATLFGRSFLADCDLPSDLVLGPIEALYPITITRFAPVSPS